MWYLFYPYLSFFSRLRWCAALLALCLFAMWSWFHIGLAEQVECWQVQRSLPAESQPKANSVPHGQRRALLRACAQSAGVTARYHASRSQIFLRGTLRGVWYVLWCLHSRGVALGSAVWESRGAYVTVRGVCE